MTAAVLVVEDELIIAKGVEKQLKGLGYAVSGLAASGEDAVRMAVERRPDLILMDINLGGGMDGVEAAGRVREQLDVPVVYLTAFSDDATLQRAKLTQPFGYILKPYDDKDLQTAIEIRLYRHRMDRRLRENEQWLAATLASIGDGLIATDEQGRVRFMNTLAEQLTGWPQADALGKGVAEVFRVVEAASRQPVPNPVLEALAKGASVSLARNTNLLSRSGRECPVDDSAAPIRDVNGRVSGAVLVFRDTTERRTLEEHLRQAQKMEAVGRLAGGIAHDFNNIMTIVTGYSDLLLSEGVLSPPMPAAERLEAIRNIHAAGQRAAALTNQIMAFSRRQILVPSVLSLNTVVRDMGGMVRRLIGSNIEFVTETDPDLGSVKADPTQLGQVILNLAVNARDAMRTGGRLVVATRNAVLGPETTRRHPDVRPGRYALLSVSDTGTGMPGEVLAHVFEPFFTTKGVGHGTGLGLATVHGIVKQSGGHIEVTSKVGEGTTFWVYLPLIDEPPPQPTSGEVRSTAKGRETILLAEDEEGVRRMTRTVLERSGYTVLEAATGPEAVRVAETHPQPIHLLLTDIIMPGLSGREVAERATRVKRGLRVLFMSGYTEDVLVHQGVESAAMDFLHKPFTLDALTHKVREVLDRP
jgi:PAS domain S-box-containing protein